MKIVSWILWGALSPAALTYSVFLFRDGNLLGGTAVLICAAAMIVNGWTFRILAATAKQMRDMEKELGR